MTNWLSVNGFIKLRPLDVRIGYVYQSNCKILSLTDKWDSLASLIYKFQWHTID
jgi:hypothetical protein